MDWHILTMLPLLGLTTNWRGVRIGGKVIGGVGGLGASNNPAVQAFDKAKAAGDREGMEKAARQLNEQRMERNRAKSGSGQNQSDPTVFTPGQNKREFVQNYPVSLDIGDVPRQAEKAGEYFFRRKKVGESVIEVTERQIASFERKDGTYSKTGFDPNFYIRQSQYADSRYRFREHPSPGYFFVSDSARLKIDVQEGL